MNFKAHTFLFGMLTIIAANPAISQDAEFSAPDGCETFLSVQSNGCRSAIFWRCTNAPEGEFWEAGFDADGLMSVLHYDSEYQWLDAEYFWDNSREVLENPGYDPISLSSLLDTGKDTFAFSMIRHEPDRSYTQFIAGSDELTGQETTIDGIKLFETSAQVTITNENGDVEYESRNHQLLSRELGLLFFADDNVTFEDGSTESFDNTPVEFIFSGEPGFARMAPVYQCDAPQGNEPKDGGSKKG